MTARESNNLAARNDAGWNLGASTLHLAKGAKPYSQDVREYVDGRVTFDGGAEVVSVTNRHWLDIGSARGTRPDATCNGEFVLKNIDWSLRNNTLCVGYNHGDGDARAADGTVVTEGGRFSLVKFGDLWLGGYAAGVIGEVARGHLRLGGDTLVYLEGSNIRVGYQMYSSLSPVEGRFDGRAVTGGEVDVSYIGAGYNGNPGYGEVLFGTNWNVRTKAIRAGYASSGTASTGTVSFAEGGSLSGEMTAFTIGCAEGGSGAFVKGRLIGNHLDKVDLKNASGVAYIGRGCPYGEGDGLVDFSTNDGGRFDMSFTFYIASTARAIGKMLLGEDWTFRMSMDQPHDYSFNVGHECTEGGVGLFSMKSGRFEGAPYALRVGYNGKNLDARVDLGRSDVFLDTPEAYVGYGWSGSDKIRGVFDASASTNVTFNATKMWLGFREAEYDIFGHLLLGRGQGTVSEMIVGARYEPIPGLRQGLLDLKGFRMKLTTSAELRRTAQIRVVAEKGSAGLDVARDAVLNVIDTRTEASGPVMTIDFRGPAADKICTLPSNGDSIYWGFKWDGDHVDEVNAMVAAGTIVYETNGLSARDGSLIGVFYDAKTDATYIGCHTRQARDGTMLLIR